MNFIYPSKGKIEYFCQMQQKIACFGMLFVAVDGGKKTTNKMTKRLSFILMACALTVAAYGADTLRYTLKDCREMALTRGTSAQTKEEMRLAAEYNRKAALAAMFPRISANGGYMWNSKNPHLLANSSELSYGTATVNPDGTASWTWKDGATGTIPDAVGQTIADVYKTVYDKLTLDLQHVVVAQVGITQPIYTGGRLTQLYKIAQATEKIANIESEAKHNEIIFAVDEAYWRVVSVGRKKGLAEQYYNLLCQLEKDVQEAVNEGVATQADLLKVVTKRGEAEVKKLQAENGLTLSQMALAQVCGLPLGSVFQLDESELSNISLPAVDADAAVSNRSELRMLQESEKIAKYNAKLMAAGLQPNIVASAGYIYTNPNADNGVSSNWDGTGFFSASVIVNVPIVHADDILRYKAAKHAANAVKLQTEQTRELLTLQTTQANQKLAEAQQKIALARLTQNNAAEVLRMAEASYEAGMITASELMQAQTAWLAAATDLVDAETEAKTTETQLRKYLGQL